MDFGEIFKLVVAVSGIPAAILGTPKVVREFRQIGRSQLRDEYKFAKEFFCEVKNNPEMPIFLIDKGYKAIAGNDRINSNIIKYLISLPEPVRALRCYIEGREYLDVVEDGSFVSSIAFRGKYKSKKYRYLKDKLYLALYGISSFLIFSPFVFSVVFSWKFPNMIILLSTFLFTLLFFGSIAVLCLRFSTALSQSENLIIIQDKNI